MARSRPSPSAKGKAKAYAPPTRASPRLAALWAKASPPSPTPPPSPVPSLPLKKRAIPYATLVPPLAARKGTSKMSAQPIHRRSQRIIARGGTSTSAPKEKVVIAISNSESENVLGNDSHFWNNDGDLSDWQNADPPDSSAGSCTGLPPAL
ncbi:hypothetical protein PIB30_047405 [Stylosanthes scabra]|uniref:Uncharacterized protein n=1 Tax=Stylosanthes scabra TaxID=79078 RepID=A0ABU6RH07_9FABA|nr:hypothetical protein [Stylosanthes scabra]